MTNEDPNFTEFSQEYGSEYKYDEYVYENITQEKCDSDTDDEMESVDDLETADRSNSEYDDNFSVHNKDVVMVNESWNTF